jgi:methylase of polypeptide subunit release factors
LEAYYTEKAVSDPAIPSITKEQVEESLSRLGRYLTSMSAEVLSMSLAAAILPGIVWAFIWRRSGDRYVLDYQLPTPSNAKIPLEDFAKNLAKVPGQSILRTKDILKIDATETIEMPLEKEIDSGRIARAAHRVILIPYRNGDRILEVYTGNTSGEMKDLSSRGGELSIVLDTLHRGREEALQSLATSAKTEGPVQEAQLFDVIHHEIKAWLGKSLGAAHLFLYDARDRMLYHRATSSLIVSRSAVKDYKPAPQAKTPELLGFVSTNIEQFEGASAELKEDLEAILKQLANENWMRENAVNFSDQLRHLLSLLPQEPGTGVAGHTARTGIPEISNQKNEALWNPLAYPATMWFPLMLSVEQLFGIATGGSVAAVPLRESGQLAGVLFVMRDVPFDPVADTLSLIEKAAQASPLLTLYRTQQFHQALVRASVDSPAMSIADIVAENAYRAFNTPLVAHWRFGSASPQAVALWGFDGRYSRYRHLATHLTASGIFRNSSITGEVVRWSKEHRTDIVDRPPPDELHKWALPSEELLRRLEAAADVELKSALIVRPPDTKDVLVLYTEERGDDLRQNKPQIMQKIATMRAVEKLRSAPKQSKQQFVGESGKIREVLALAETAAKKPRILIYGPSGSGKSLLAQCIYEMSSRGGRLEILTVSQDNPDIFNQLAYGQVAGALGPGSPEIKGSFENDGGTVVVNDIDVASPRIRGALLNILDIKTSAFTPAGGKPRKVDVQIIATTNKSKEVLKGDGERSDMVRRFKTTIAIPPLSDRRLDIPLLARHFLAERDATSIPVTAEAMCALMNIDFEFDADGVDSLIERLIDNNQKTITKGNVERIASEYGTNAVTRPVWLKDVTGHFKRWTASDEPTKVFLTRDVYPPNEDPSEDWVQFSIRGFRVLGERLAKDNGPRGIDRYLSVGCGAGLDAVAAARILRPRGVFLTDLHGDVVSVARENVLGNSNLTLANITRQCGNLFEAMPAKSKADVIFENLPVIPEDEGVTIEGRRTGTFFGTGGNGVVPELFRQWTLTSHYLFLLDAKKFLSPKGSVVCSIGARMPWDIVEKMFVELGYTPELLVYDMKEQEELAEVAGGLAKLERDHGIKFRFFDLGTARAALQSISKAQEDCDAGGLRGFAVSRGEADKRLEDIVMTAQDALAYKERVGHMVYIVRGIPRDDTGMDLSM